MQYANYLSGTTPWPPQLTGLPFAFYNPREEETWKTNKEIKEENEGEEIDKEGDREDGGEGDRRLGERGGRRKIKKEVEKMGEKEIKEEGGEIYKEDMK